MQVILSAVYLHARPAAISLKAVSSEIREHIYVAADLSATDPSIARHQGTRTEEGYSEPLGRQRHV